MLNSTRKGFSLRPGNSPFLVFGVGFIVFGMIFFIIIIPRDGYTFIGSSLLAIGAYNFIGSGYLARRVLVSTAAVRGWNPWALAGDAGVRVFFKRIGCVVGAAGGVFLMRAALGI